MNIKTIAERACYKLAGWIYSGDSYAWQIADRIERRWNCVGATQYWVDHLVTEHRRWQARENERLNARYPENQIQ